MRVLLVPASGSPAILRAAQCAAAALTTARTARTTMAVLAVLTGLTVGGCVTINIYFPAAAAEQAADRIIDEIYQLRKDAPAVKPADTK